jgi:hypothetical protein
MLRKIERHREQVTLMRCTKGRRALNRAINHIHMDRPTLQL